jgi:hypothetical protein
MRIKKCLCDDKCLTYDEAEVICKAADFLMKVHRELGENLKRDMDAKEIPYEDFN